MTDKGELVEESGKTLLKFFALVALLSAVFWAVAATTGLELMPGLSITVLAALCPALVALTLAYQNRGTTAMQALLKRSVDFRRIYDLRWLVPVLFLMPAVSLVVFGLMRCMNMPLPALQFQVWPAMLMFVGFCVLALGEELGWSGYALEPMQARWGALGAGVLLGLVGIVWHLTPLLLMGRPLIWIAWWCLYALTIRIFVVWLFNNTGESVFAVALFHATVNMAYVLFPVYGSHFDMRLAGLVMAGLALLVIAVWGPKTLTSRTNGQGIAK